MSRRRAGQRAEQELELGGGGALSTARGATGAVAFGRDHAHAGGRLVADDALFFGVAEQRAQHGDVLADRRLQRRVSATGVITVYLRQLRSVASTRPHRPRPRRRAHARDRVRRREPHRPYEASAQRRSGRKCLCAQSLDWLVHVRMPTISGARRRARLRCAAPPTTIVPRGGAASAPRTRVS
jgi:hypothetical protein